eukprot:NODE_3732_length_858_cov_66.310534_g3709_i0.p1 GENE.NODE_3732_length_858_cov_66.310534_g3709_i0~~NODE_3732_length_858_cov_66.310534_g3709_i0.p1  ORF type:complete len:186 (-),score=7.54 NODE_3732_length_858_cov_66.310534_g3709_i0:179-736(-)
MNYGRSLDGMLFYTDAPPLPRAKPKNNKVPLRSYSKGGSKKAKRLAAGDSLSPTTVRFPSVPRKSRESAVPPILTPARTVRVLEPAPPAAPPLATDTAARRHKNAESIPPSDEELFRMISKNRYQYGRKRREQHKNFTNDNNETLRPDPVDGRCGTMFADVYHSPRQVQNEFFELRRKVHEVGRA